MNAHKSNWRSSFLQRLNKLLHHKRAHDVLLPQPFPFLIYPCHHEVHTGRVRRWTQAGYKPTQSLATPSMSLIPRPLSSSVAFGWAFRSKAKKNGVKELPKIRPGKQISGPPFLAKGQKKWQRQDRGSNLSPPPPMNRKLWTKGHFFFRPSGTCTANFFGNFDKFLLQTVPKERHLGPFWEKVFCLALWRAKIKCHSSGDFGDAV